VRAKKERAGENDDGRYKKIRISRAKKAESVYLFLGKTSLRNKLSIDRSIDRSIEGGLFERASEEEEEKSRRTFFSRRLTLRPVVFDVLRWFL